MQAYESQLPLDLSSIINPFLEEIGNDIFEKDKTEKFLQQFVQLLDSEGQYSEDLSCKGIPTKAPIISYSPALILRKRSSALLTATLEHIRWNLLQQKDLPAGFKDLCELK